MKLRNLVPFTLLVAAALPGCDETSSQTCDVVVSGGFRGISINGMSLNGTSFNGVNLNGTSLNGEQHNGVSLNGEDENGVSLNGAERNGVSINGKSLNGKSLNGKSLNGISLNGIDLGKTAILAGRDQLAHADLVGTALRATASDGTVVEGADWVGAIVQASVGDETIDLRIAAVEADAADPSIEWYVLELEGESICGPGQRGLFMPGVWDETGARHDAFAGDQDVAFSFSCETGALAKCIDWGYAPHAVGADAHQTCTRLVRADYCGTGEPHTANGTLVDVFDTLGVMEPDTSVDLAFEAGWGPDGALCVSRPRYVELDAAGDEIVASCLDELPVCDTAIAAVAQGATLMNRSAPQTLCYE
jgi:hypothetical protein